MVYIYNKVTEIYEIKKINTTQDIILLTFSGLYKNY